MIDYTAPVLVIGDLILDEYIWGTVERISPEAPVPILKVDRTTYAAGGAGNVAENIRSLGGKTFLLSKSGHCDNSKIYRGLLSSRDNFISTDCVYSMTKKTRTICGDRHLLRMDSDRFNELNSIAMDTSGFRTELPRLIAESKSIVVCDYGKGMITNEVMAFIFEEARKASIPVIADPYGSDISKYRGVTLLKPNLAEAVKLSNGRWLVEAGMIIKSNLLEFGKTSVLITNGSNGMSLFEHDKYRVEIPPFPCEVKDVTGAGDTVAAVLGICLASGIDLPKSCEYASRAASVVVGKMGTATITREEFEGTFRKYLRN